VGNLSAAFSGANLNDSASYAVTCQATNTFGTFTYPGPYGQPVVGGQAGLGTFDFPDFLHLGSIFPSLQRGTNQIGGLAILVVHLHLQDADGQARGPAEVAGDRAIVKSRSRKARFISTEVLRRDGRAVPGSTVPAMPEGADGKALRACANTYGVDVRHGAQFSPTGALGNHLRLSYAFYDDADIAEGVARLGRALHSV
jgi:hypothetical protein